MVTGRLASLIHWQSISSSMTGFYDAHSSCYIASISHRTLLGSTSIYTPNQILSSWSSNYCNINKVINCWHSDREFCCTVFVIQGSRSFSVVSRQVNAQHIIIPLSLRCWQLHQIGLQFLSYALHNLTKCKKLALQTCRHNKCEGSPLYLLVIIR